VQTVSSVRGSNRHCAYHSVVMKQHSVSYRVLVAIFGMLIAGAGIAEAQHRLDPATMCRNGTGRFATDVAVCTAAISSGKHQGHDLSSLLTARARVQRYLDQCDKALVDATAAVKETPWLTTAHVERGQIHRCLGEHAKSLNDYDAAIANNKRDAAAWRNRGIAAFFLERHNDAVDSLAQSINFSSNNPEAWAFSALAHTALGDFEAAGWAMLRCDEQRFAWELTSAWRAISIARADGDPSPIYTKALAKLDNDEWPAPLLRFLSGEIDMAAYRTAIETRSNRNALLYYAGLRALILGEETRARQIFGEITPGNRSVEQILSRAELARLK